MSLPASGTLSLLSAAGAGRSIRGEWAPASGGYNFRAYLKGAGIVTALDTAPNVPASGTIKFSNFYSAAHVTAVTYTTSFFPTAAGVLNGTWTTPGNTLASDNAFGVCTPPANSANPYVIQLDGFAISSTVLASATINWAKIHVVGKVGSIISPRLPTLTADLYDSSNAYVGGWGITASTTNGDYSALLGSFTAAQVRAWSYISCTADNAGTVATSISLDAAYVEINYTQ